MIAQPPQQPTGPREPPPARHSSEVGNVAGSSQEEWVGRSVAGQGGSWSAVGEEYDAGLGEGKSVPSAEWLRRLAPGAAAVIAIGTCATWGGIPAAIGNVTNSMSLMDYLGKDYRSALGLPVVNVPGCSPVGDNFTETVASVLVFLQGLGPVPEFDELGRPAWLFSETVHRTC